MGKDYFLCSDEYYPQNNGEFSNSIIKNWTPQAIECYTINCDCKKCSLAKGNYSFVCQMPKVIRALLDSGININAA